MQRIWNNYLAFGAAVFGAGKSLTWAIEHVDGQPEVIGITLLLGALAFSTFSIIKAARPPHVQ